MKNNRSLLSVNDRRHASRIGLGALLAGCAVLALSGCRPAATSGRGFQLPPGTPAMGKQAFIDLKCYTCHRVEGIADLPPPTQPPEKIVVLGGEVAQVRTYGRLMTAIIHPSQSISEKMIARPEKQSKESPMPSVNEIMTVEQLINLIAFLQSQYRELQPLYEQYPMM